MFKAIILFIKAHIIASTITATVVVGTAIATPIVVENYKLDKNVKENLGMLATNNNETSTNTITNSNETLNEDNQNNANEELTFKIEKVVIKTEDGNEGTEFKIIPSYDKDYSEWTKQEKEAYQRAFEEANRMVKEEYDNRVSEEKQALDNIDKELEKIVNSWSKAYSIGTSTIAYNSYIQKYKGHISNGGKWNEQGIYVENGGRDIEVSKEEFRNTIYYELMQNIKNDKNSIQSDKDNYLSQLNELYHLSD